MADITTDLVTWDAADATSNWYNIGTFASSPVANADMPIQGTNCIVGRISANSAWELAHPSGTVDLSSGKHIFVWMKNVTWPGTDTITNGGMRVAISSDATATLTGTSPSNGPTNSKQWYVGGSDTDTITGWTCYVVDPTGTPAATGSAAQPNVSPLGLVIGAPNDAAIATIGGGAKVTATIGSGNFKPDNFLIDAVRYGTGLTVNNGTSGAPHTFADFWTFDGGTIADVYGVITKEAGIYLVAGKLYFGTAAQAALTYFADSNEVIVFRNFPVNLGFYELKLAGASGFITTVQLGTFTNSVPGNGVTIQGAGSAIWTLTASDANSVFKAYACTFSSMRSAALNSSVVLNGCNVVASGTVTPSGATIAGCIFSGLATAAPISALVINSPSELAAVTKCQFINCNRAIRITAAGTYTMDGNLFSGNAYDVENTSTGAVIINATNGSNVATHVETNGGTTTINNSVTLTLNGLKSGSNLDILAAGTSTVLANQESSGTSYDYVYSYVAGTYVDIVVYDDGYVPFTIRNYLLGSSSASLPIAQVPDRNYVA
jgi:hypothetical protein